jgi:hypothetical protein
VSSVRVAVIAELEGRAAALTLRAANLEATGYPMEGHSSQARRNRLKSHLMDMASMYRSLVTELEVEAL